MKGPRPKPTALKKLVGNPGKRALPQNEPKPAGNLDEPPAWMSESQRAGWRYAMAHAPRGLLKKIDRGILTAWVVAEDVHRQATEKLAAGLVVTTKSGAEVQSAYLPIVNRQALIMMRAADHLGFSPAARPRLASGTKPPQDDDDETGAAAESGERDSAELGAYLARNPSRLN